MFMDYKSYDSSDVNNQSALDFLSQNRKLFTSMTPIKTDIGTRVSPDSSIRAVLFDIYGTILISEAGDIGLTALDKDGTDSTFILRSGSDTKDLSFDTIRSQLTDLIKKHHGLIRQNYPQITYPEVDIIRIWSELFIENGLKEPSAEDLTRGALLFEITSNRVDLMPGSREIFNYLRKTGMPMGIVSNAQFYTPLLMEFLFKESLEEMGFNSNLASWSYRCGCGKPDPLIFKTPVDKLMRMGIKKKEILYVGNDMLNDVSCASGLGLKTVLFAGDHRSLRLREDDDRVKTEADYIINDLLQLKQIVREGANE